VEKKSVDALRRSSLCQKSGAVIYSQDVVEADGLFVNKKKSRIIRPGPLEPVFSTTYLSAFDIVVNVVFKCVPRPFTTGIITTEMPAAIKPYSIAVAPDSSRTNRLTIVFI
jgi:hypothetical protein